MTPTTTTKIPKPAAETMKRWMLDCEAFVRECLGAEPDAWQSLVLRDVNDPKNQRIALKASKGPGKTTLLAWVAWWFLATRDNPKVIATSITGPNLADGLWSEMAKWQANSTFLQSFFTWKKESITANHAPGTWFMAARTFSTTADKSQQAQTLAGKHAENMLFILDEVGDIPDAVMVAAEGALSTGTELRLLIAGNPTRLEGPLYRACVEERGKWKVHEISGDPDDPNRAPRVSIKWAREQIERDGKDNPWVMVNVFGKFPPSSFNSLLGPNDVLAAFKRNPNYDDWAFSQRRLGCDVARFGDDRTAIMLRQGKVAFIPEILRPESSAMAWSQFVAGRILNVKKGVNLGDIKGWRSDVEFIDSTGGYGGGVIDALRAMGESPIAVDFSSRLCDPQFYNKRAEMWWRMAEWVKQGGALPNIPDLMKELTKVTYTYKDGKIILLSKEQLKAELGFSPDLADALALTFAEPDRPRSMGEYPFNEVEQKEAIHEYDIYQFG